MSRIYGEMTNGYSFIYGEMTKGYPLIYGEMNLVIMRNAVTLHRNALISMKHVENLWRND